MQVAFAQLIRWSSSAENRGEGGLLKGASNLAPAKQLQLLPIFWPLVGCEKAKFEYEQEHEKTLNCKCLELLITGSGKDRLSTVKMARRGAANQVHPGTYIHVGVVQVFARWLETENVLCVGVRRFFAVSRSVPNPFCMMTGDLSDLTVLLGVISLISE